VIARIVEFSARNRLLILLLTVAASSIGWWSMKEVPLDALPDLSDSQVIIYSKWDRSPDIVEDQVTYPIVTALLGAPKVKEVRGFSDFGYSYVYATFEDGTDLYWARSRTQEYLAGILPNLPPGVKTTLGPDATGLGWIFQYALVDTSGQHTLTELRSAQDWYLRYHLKSVPGVSEVATVGGSGRQYQINVDPRKLQAYGIGINQVVEAVRGGNVETGARLIELNGAEHMIRGIGYAKSIHDLESSVITAVDGTPILVRDVGQVVEGPDSRRGETDLDGTGAAVSGIVVMRNGENALHVIQRVKARLKEIEPGLPKGVKLIPVYDRSQLIERSISNLKRTILEVILTVTVVILLFLGNAPSALIPAITIPIAVLISFIPFQQAGLTANVMSLGGIAIAIGALVDAAIVMVEQTHKRLEEWEADGRQGSHSEVVIRALKEVAGPGFFSLLVIAVSFLPVLALEGQEGRLFKPLALAKTLAMFVAAVLAITLDPALRLMLTHARHFRFRPRWLARTVEAILSGRVQQEQRHPISRFLIRCYEPVVRWSLRHRVLVLGTALGLIVITVPVVRQLGSEFMPPLDEGALLYMPSTMPGISITEAQRLVQVTDRILRQFPEVDHVLGKTGRAETATDPAPLSMLETVVTLKPKSEWRRVPTWYSSWSPEWLKPILGHFQPDHISAEDLMAEMNRALAVPGVTNAWTMPIRGRVDMLTTGMRTPVGIKVMGSDPGEVGRIGEEVEAALRSVDGARSVFAERTGDGYFFDVVWNREQLSRYGITMEQAQDTLSAAVGGEDVTTTVEGRARYPVNVRYLRDFRADPQAIGRVLVATGDGKRQIPIAELAVIRATSGPAMIRDEDGLITGYVYVDLANRDIGAFVEKGKRVLAQQLVLPPGYSIRWTGQYEVMERVSERLRVVVPLTVLLIFLLLWINTRSVVQSCIVLLAVPFSAVGAFWLLYALHFNLSVAVWIGIIALLGVDAETGIFMLLYLEQAFKRFNGTRGFSRADLHEAIIDGAVRRIRPKFMTAITMVAGLVPILWSDGTGSDVMKRIAAPMVGGIVTSFLLELVVYPVIYDLWRWQGRTKQRPLSAEMTLEVAESEFDPVRYAE
jgi:Cu(I)/Ag(I) efflux system membrane protein CusA/SilA